MASPLRPHQAFAKPIGALCNLECRYCYYLEKRGLYPGGSFRMSDEDLEEYIVGHIQASPEEAITFVWHGGEPTLLGPGYFERIVALQSTHRPPGRRVLNSLQTNGTLLDEGWCRFLAANTFHVGLSLDGPAALHDCNRVARGEKPTHARVVRAQRLLRRHRIVHDVMCVVHAGNVEHPVAVYRFFKDIKARYLGLLPLVQRRSDGPGVSERSVSGEALGEFLCTIFDEWASRDVGRIRVQLFDEALASARGRESSLCIFRETCGDVPAVEHNGDFFSCDHFVDAEHRVGNIRETPLRQLLDSPAQREFGRAKSETLPRLCRTCDVLSMCHGGCPKDRIGHTPDGEPGLNHLCAGYRRFFTHVRAHAAKLRGPGRAPSPAPALRVAPAVGRNDPCPCGSGLKYKRCCLAGRPGPS